MLDVLKKVGIYLFGFLFIFGLVGSTVLFVWHGRNKTPPRPDLELNAWIASRGIDSGLAVSIARFPSNRVAKQIFFKHWPPLPGQETGVEALADELGEAEREPLFALGTLGDQFVNQAVLLLHDRGAVDLDKPIGAFLEDLPTHYQDILVYQLLSHSSGIDPSWTDTTTEWPPLATPPGERSVYAVGNLLLANKLLEKASGQSAPRFIVENILEPLEMKRTVFRSESEVEAGQPVGWYSCLTDVSNWELAFYRRNLIRLKTYLRAFRPALGIGEKRLDYGLGWELKEYGGLRMEQAPGDGALGPTNHCILRFSERAFSIVVLSDKPVSEQDSSRLAREIAQIYLAREMPFAERIAHERPILDGI